MHLHDPYQDYYVDVCPLMEGMPFDLVKGASVAERRAMAVV
jgi:hypothetical protein